MHIQQMLLYSWDGWFWFSQHAIESEIRMCYLNKFCRFSRERENSLKTGVRAHPHTHTHCHRYKKQAYPTWLCGVLGFYGASCLLFLPSPAVSSLLLSSYLLYITLISISLLSINLPLTSLYLPALYQLFPHHIHLYQLLYITLLSINMSPIA